jgi:hypothetical protein
LAIIDHKRLDVAAIVTERIARRVHRGGELLVALICGPSEPRNVKLARNNSGMTVLSCWRQISA